MSASWKRTILLILLGIAFIPFPATAGMKVGIFIPTNSDFQSAPAFSLDGKFSVTENLKLGF